MAIKKGGLGRGLGDILDDVELTYKKEFLLNNDLVIELNVNEIAPNPYQPRQIFDQDSLQELGESIKAHGLIQPIIVIKKDGAYTLIAGERRLRASKLVGIHKIKAIVADLKSQNLRELALIENIQRKDLNPIELANSYKELINEYKITQEALSDIVKKSRAQITNTLRLLNLCDYVKNLVFNNKISQGHAKILVVLDEKDQIKISDTIIGQKLSVSETEELVRKLKSSPKKINKEKLDLGFEFKNAMKDLNQNFKNLGLKTKVKDRKITIEFLNKKDIDKFLENFHK